MYALDAVTGDEVWRTATADHSMAANTGSPTVALGKIFIPQASAEILAAPDDSYECCHTAGAVVALDLETGKILWRFRTIAEQAKVVGKRENGTSIYAPSGAPVWSSPTADPKRGLLYIGTGENFTRPTTDSSDAIIALDMNTGKKVWSFQATAGDGWTTACGAEPGSNCPDPAGPDLDFGMAPMLVTQPSGKQMLVVGQKSGVVHALDPDNKGKVLWQTRLGRGSNLGGIHWGMASDGVQAYATVNDPVNPGDDGIAADNTHPLANGIFALEVSSGKKLWSTLSDTSVCEELEGCLARYSAAPAAVPGLVTAGDLSGMVRIFSANTGKLLWQYDTNVEFKTVNGINAHGGSIDGPSPVIAEGMLITNSGYLLFGQKPGNVLVAFEVDK